MLDGVNNVASASLTLGADHGRSFSNAAQSFAQIARSADKGDGEGMLDVMGFVGGGKHFGFVNVIDAQLLENLSLSKMPNAALRHHRDGNRRHNLANLLRRSHARNPALSADLRRNALECHNSYRASLFGYRSLLGVGYVHNYSPFSISARPVFRRRLVELPLFWDMCGLFSGCGFGFRAGAKL